MSLGVSGFAGVVASHKVEIFLDDDDRKHPFGTFKQARSKDCLRATNGNSAFFILVVRGVGLVEGDTIMDVVMGFIANEMS